MKQKSLEELINTSETIDDLIYKLLYYNEQGIKYIYMEDHPIEIKTIVHICTKAYFNKEDLQTVYKNISLMYNK